MAWYDDTSKKATVREYKSRAEMDREVAKAAEQGWRVVTVNDLSQRAGCARMGCLGFFALIWKPKSKILVTYAHD